MIAETPLVLSAATSLSGGDATIALAFAAASVFLGLVDFQLRGSMM